MGKSRQFSIEPSRAEPPDNRSRHERFVQMAEELGRDENDAGFDVKLKGIAKAKPKTDNIRPAGG